MKKLKLYLIIIVFLGAALAIIILHSKKDTPILNNISNTSTDINTNITTTSTSSTGNPFLINNANEILNLSDVATNRTAYKGTITVNGVVNEILADSPNVFALIDTVEAQACNTAICSTFYFPVRYEGTMPNVGDEVNVTGTFQGTLADGNMYFMASKVIVIKNIFKSESNK